MTTFWAQPADVVTFTGRTVTEAQLGQAEAQLELVVGVLANPAERPGVEIKPRDLAYLKRAVSYQAAWLAVQPDAYDRSDIASISQDGTSATFTEKGLILAPFARRAIRRLSWLGSRSITAIPTAERILSEYVDDDLPWTNLAGPSGTTSAQDWQALP